MTRLRICHSALLVTALLLAAAPAANAYIGPGAGLSAIGSVLSVLAAMLLAVVGFVWYPLKRLLRRGKAKAPPSAAPSLPSEAAKE